MDKQKQIEEMARDINNTWFVKPNGDICGTNEKLKKNDIQMISHQLICDGYRKIPENAVVLTREEYEWLTCCFGKFEEIMNDIKEQSRKETAEKFAERMREQYPPRTHERCTLDDCYMLDKIDEICKEFTEGLKCQE